MPIEATVSRNNTIMLVFEYLQKLKIQRAATMMKFIIKHGTVSADINKDKKDNITVIKIIAIFMLSFLIVMFIIIHVSIILL